MPLLLVINATARARLRLVWYRVIWQQQTMTGDWRYGTVVAKVLNHLKPFIT